MWLAPFDFAGTETAPLALMHIVDPLPAPEPRSLQVEILPPKGAEVPYGKILLNFVRSEQD